MGWSELPEWALQAGGLAVILAFTLLNMRVGRYRDRCRDEAPSERASSEAGRTYYPVGLAYRRAVYGAYTFYLSFGVALLVWVDVPWFYAAALYPLVWLMLSVELESAITVSQRGVERTWLFGLIQRRIDWDDADRAAIDYRKVEGIQKPIIEVWSHDDSRRIVHTYLHTDQRRFLAEVRARVTVYGSEEDLEPGED